jgi:hypothetical protein
MEQANEFLPLCDLICSLSVLELLNKSPHCRQVEGSSECHFKWAFSLLDTVNFFGHRVQAKGLSPVCNLRCSFKWLPWKNDFSQKEQAKDLSLSGLTCALKYNQQLVTITVAM